MKAIVISQEEFAHLFEGCLDKLTLSKCRHGIGPHTDPEVRRQVEDMHRQFHYHVVGLQRAIENAS